jgi:HPt (histidine-containing phosphotransfer) domain-containing protein
MSSALPLNPHIIHEACGQDTALIQELVQVFVQQTQVTLDELQLAVGQHDWPQVVYLAHKVKGSAIYLGAQAMTQAAHGLEQAAAVPQPAECLAHHQALQAAFIATKTAIPQVFQGITV